MSDCPEAPYSFLEVHLGRKEGWTPGEVRAIVRRKLRHDVRYDDGCCPIDDLLKRGLPTFYSGSWRTEEKEALAAFRSLTDSIDGKEARILLEIGHLIDMARRS